MKATTLLYHDIVPEKEFSFSGFNSPAANLYKFTDRDFMHHLSSLHKAAARSPVLVWDYLVNERQEGKSFMLTFDDGGVCAYSHLMRLLAEVDWKSHFFITTNYIGTPSFLDKQQIIELDAMGHIIGSHSASHPTVMSSLTYPALLDEWKKSRATLEDILGKDVRCASIPGGYYSKNVALAASEAGIRALFTSEPVRRSFKVGECAVIGRYTIFRRMSPAKAASIASDSYSACFGQWFYWNIKKAAKMAGGRYYLLFRDMIADGKRQ